LFHWNAVAFGAGTLPPPLSTLPAKSQQKPLTKKFQREIPSNTCDREKLVKKKHSCERFHQ
jgi:hypothetical protein